MARMCLNASEVDDSSLTAFTHHHCMFVTSTCLSGTQVQWISSVSASLFIYKTDELRMHQPEISILAQSSNVILSIIQ